MSRAINFVADWSDDEINAVLLRAGELADGGQPRQLTDLVVGMCFFQTSLRTRVGFEVAAHRLGAKFVEVVERRSSAESMPEPIEDTIRVVSGYCDALIVRSPRPSQELSAAALPGKIWLNAGDSTEHPTQALIDLFTIERLTGDLSNTHVAIVGDLRMRSVRSLLALFDRKPPAALSVATDAQLGVSSLPGSVTVVETAADIAHLGPGVVYLAGIPHRAVNEDVRTRLRFDRDSLARLGAGTVVLSPLPLIDEVASNAREDPHIRWFDQSDLGLFVRIAVLELLLRGLG